MTGVDPKASEPTEALARVADPQKRYRIGARVLTMDLAELFAEILCSDMSHSVESAALAAGLKPSTVRDAISRYNKDDCKTLADEEVCEVIVRAKADHIKHIRAAGYVSAGKANRAGTAWMQWQLEVQAPLEHPRKQETTVELTGKDGGPIETNSAIRYVVHVPEAEPEE